MSRRSRRRRTGAGRRPTLAAAAGTVVAAVLAACGTSDDPSAQPRALAEEAWARPVAAVPAVAAGDHAHHGASATTAVYLVIHNPGPQTDRLLGAESPVARAAEVHESRLDEGVVRMRRIDAVRLPPGEPVHFAPGGLHLMLIGVQRALEPGDRFPLTLHLERQGAREIEVEVRQPR